MDVTQLKTLIHVAELGSLSRAADRLNIAQPALSRQIRLLEQELGTTLFERHGRGMIITETGSEILGHAVKVMAELEAIRNAAAAGRTSLHGTVRIGTTPTVAQFVTLPLVERIRAAHPLLAVRFASAFSGFLLDWLQRGELDVVVSYDPEPLPSLRIVPVMMEKLLFVGPADADFSLDDTMAFSRLADCELILPSPRHGLRRLMDACATRAGIRLNTRVEVESFSGMIDLVRAGLGMTVLPLAPIHGLIESGAIRAAQLVDPTPERRLVLAYRSDAPVDPAARFVGEEFRRIARELAAQGSWMGQILDETMATGPGG
ncbi:LysR family transcriptional regulator [Acuticoccus kandeliae]|uniref:LysR family transcriptional regulator n=1 Tax=Acuticoccus kandeliae TaxID=2073160 RepID=UPI000D3EBC77|nr:LysR substrate-binding domain-containing protein [Acuticoccus kandeliae]